MGRAFSITLAFFAFLLVFALAGCSGGNNSTTTFPTPASITLTPTPNTSMELGKTLSFTGIAKDAAGTTVTTPLSFVSSNTAVLTVASSGLACAGSWDSLSSPQICTPGPSGVAQVTATAQGVSSPPTTVYVHQHVDNIAIAPVPDQVFPAKYNQGNCVSSSDLPTNQKTLKYMGTAFSNGIDITSTVGPFSWTITNTTVASSEDSTTLTTLPTNQVQITAKVPGTTMLFATLGSTTSSPVSFLTCPVKSIELAVSPPPPFTDPLTPLTPFNTPQVLATSGTATIYARVMDSVQLPLTNAPLTWTASNTPVLGVASTSTTVFGGQAAATATAVPGGSSVIATCVPTTCNIGLPLTSLVYPQKAVSFVVTLAGTATRPTSSVWVSSTGCGNTNGCISTVASINGSSTLTFTAGTPLPLPATPNSLLFDAQGTNGFFGTDQGFSGTRGLMMLSGGTVSQFVSTPGKVLAISPDGKKVVSSDTVDTPNVVYIFDTTAKTSIALNITGATAADFSPDSLKAYIVAGNTLYLYSPQAALQSIQLSGPGGAASFLPVGAFGYLASRTAPNLTVRKICDNTIAQDQNGVQQTVTLSAVPTFLAALPVSSTVLAVNSNGADLVDADTTVPLPYLKNATSGCSQPTGLVPGGTPVVSNALPASFSFGQGTFTPTQLIVSSDGTRAYVLGVAKGTSGPVANIMVLNIASPSSASTSFTIGLTGNALPLRAALDEPGSLLYVGTTDGTVHVLDTTFGTDIAQVSFTKSLCQDSLGNPAAVPSCNPNLITIAP